MADYLLNDKAAESFVALITPAVNAVTLIKNVQVVAGKNYDNKTVPIVICEVNGDGEEDPKLSGNFWLSWSIKMRHSAVADEDASGQTDGPEMIADDQALVTAVTNALMVDDLPQQLSALATDFTVFDNGILFNAPNRTQNELGTWEDELSGRMYCCARSGLA